MTDAGKFKALLAACLVLTGLVLVSALTQGSYLDDFDSYIRRRIYYERVISKKGLSLQKGMYWKEKQ